MKQEDERIKKVMQEEEMNKKKRLELFRQVINPANGEQLLYFNIGARENGERNV